MMFVFSTFPLKNDLSTCSSFWKFNNEQKDTQTCAEE